MEKETTPAEIRPNRTVFRLTTEETEEALAQWLARQQINVPKGKLFVWVKENHTRHADNWLVTLGVDHYDPPPEQKGGG